MVNCDFQNALKYTKCFRGPPLFTRGDWGQLHQCKTNNFHTSGY